MEHFLPLSNINSPVWADQLSLFYLMANTQFFRNEIQGRLEVSGPDALEFLQGQFSNDLSSIEVGQVVYGLWLDRKGKIVADSFVLRRAEQRFTLLSYYCAAESIHDRVDAYLIMEEAELECAKESPSALCVLGDGGQEAVCESLGLALPEAGRFTEMEGALAFWGRRGGVSALEIVFLDGSESACIGKADACLSGLGSVELDAAEISALAIGSGVPLIGRGFGESDLPQELGLEVDAVSFRKGCYLGQEVMARLHAMGRVRKELRIVGIEDSNTSLEALLPLDLLDRDEKRQGQLRSVAYPKSGGVGLAVVSVGCSSEALMAGTLAVKLLPRREIS